MAGRFDDVLCFSGDATFGTSPLILVAASSLGSAGCMVPGSSSADVIGLSGLATGVLSPGKVISFNFDPASSTPWSSGLAFARSPAAM